MPETHDLDSTSTSTSADNGKPVPTNTSSTKAIETATTLPPSLTVDNDKENAAVVDAKTDDSSATKTGETKPVLTEEEMAAKNAQRSKRGRRRAKAAERKRLAAEAEAAGITSGTAMEE